MKVIKNNRSLSFCCGVYEVGKFQEHDPNYHSWYHDDVVEKSGTGMFVSTFINNTACREAYKQLTEQHTLLYQSPTKQNGRNGNEVFLCVFMYGKKKVK